MTRNPRRLLITALAATAIIIGVITLSPIRLDRPIRRVLINLIAVVNDAHILPRIHYSLFEHLANIAIFVPTGFVLVLLLPQVRWWVVPAIAAGASICIEITQALLLPDRIASITDVLLNTIGALIGTYIAMRMLNQRTPLETVHDPVENPSPTELTFTPER